MTYASILPRILQTGAGASQQIPQILASLCCSRPLIITDRMMVELGYAQRICDALTSQGLNADVFYDTVPEPTVASIQAGVAVARDGGTTASLRWVVVAPSTVPRRLAFSPDSAVSCATINSPET